MRNISNCRGFLIVSMKNGRAPIEQRNADAKAKQELETIQQTWGTMK